MTAPPMFHGFDGLMTLSQREGVDIRPTLLRVLTDLYVQTGRHSRDEERQFAELASRLLDEVDDATRAAVSARLAVYAHTPRELIWKLGLRPALKDRYAREPAPERPVERNAEKAEIETAPLVQPQTPPAPTLSMKPDDASQLVGMLLASSSAERAKIIHNLNDTPLKASTRVDPRRAARALIGLEQAAMAGDAEAFTAELADALILSSKMASQIVNDAGGELLACALKALDMRSDSFQRVLLFLNPKLGSSVMDVYRLSRLYDTITERSALILLSACRGVALAVTRAKYRPSLYDDERQRARPSSAQRPTVQPGSAAATPRRSDTA